MAVAVVALVAGVAVGAGGGGDDEDPTRVVAPEAGQRLPLRAQVGQLLISSFEGTELPDYLRRRLAAAETAGVILFGGNARTPGQLQDLTGSIQDAAGGEALVTTDQEGGTIRSIQFAGPRPSQPDSGPPQRVQSLYGAAARELRPLGVNVNLAPVADVANSTSSILEGRVFRGSYAEVSAKVQAAVRGLRRGGVGATAKHFPGLGASLASTDDEPVSVGGDRSALELPLAPFRAAIEAKVPLIMASHAFYPGFGAKRPASQSPEILRDLLRDKLKFRGAIVTDSIEAQGVLEYSSVEVAAERSIDGGADLVLMTGSGSWKRVYPRLLRKAQRSPAFRRKVARAARRVIRLKGQLGLRRAAGG